MKEKNSIINYTATGRNIESIIKNRGLSLKEVSEKTGISLRSLKNCIVGRSMLRTKSMIRLALLLDADLLQIVVINN